MRPLNLLILIISLCSAAAKAEQDSGKNKSANDTQNQQIFTVSELSKIPTGEPNMVAGPTADSVLKMPSVIKLKKACLKKKKKFSLKKIGQTDSSEIFEPRCQ